ncbi:MAG: glycosyltransferase family 9 protein [Gemmatimonadota bacterium]
MAKYRSVDRPSQILVLRLSSIGDVLLATPLVRVLRREYPGARLRFLVKPAYAELLRLNPRLDEVLTWPLDGAGGEVESARLAGVLSTKVRTLAGRIREGGSLWLVDLQASPRSRVFRALLRPERAFGYRKDYARRHLLVRAGVDRYPQPPPSVAEKYFGAVEALGMRPDGNGLELVVGDEAERTAEALLASGAGRWVAVAPGARWATKRWPAESFASAAHELARGGDRGVAVLGSAEDRQAAAGVMRALASAAVPVLDLAGRLELLEAAAVLARCDLLLANDSGAAHLAAAMRVPVVALFGSTVPQFGFAPYGTASRVVGVAGLPCRPCTHVGRPACPLGHFRCMREIAPAAVATAARELLAGAADRRG